MESVVENVRRNINPTVRQFSMNILVYLFTIVAVCLFIYFIYKFLYGGSSTSTNLVLSSQVVANDPANSKYNVSIPAIIDGGEFTINFWIYISGYTYRQGIRKHLIEIYPANGTAATDFSTILIALGSTKPSLLVRTHTIQSDSVVPTTNVGIADCSGSTDPTCAGGQLVGFQQVTDTNLVNNMKDNSLYIKDVQQFFKPMQMDENNLISSSNTCDIQDVAMQKWVNVCTVMNGKTLDIYLDGKLVKTCVYANYYKVDHTGIALKYLQSATDGKSGFDGYFSRLQVFNSALNPDEIYKTYIAGPTGSSPANDPVSFIKYIFTG
jgi:Concanavalin A-like lectin/glucanases superfamily